MSRSLAFKIDGTLAKASFQYIGASPRGRLSTP